MSKNFAILSIDNEKAETKRILDFATGPYYMFGGGIYGQRGFIGCALKHDSELADVDRQRTIDINVKKNEYVWPQFGGMAFFIQSFFVWSHWFPAICFE